MSRDSIDPGAASVADDLAQRLASVPDPLALLQTIFAAAPVGLQIYARDGRCVLVNPKHTELFGGVPPPEYNVFEDTILVERGLADLVRRAFAGERISIPPLWYDTRELRNVSVTSGRRIAVGAELVPLRARAGGVEYVLFVFNDVTATEEAREQAEEAARVAERARTTAETVAAHSAFLAEAGRLLASSLDYEHTLAQLAKLATPALADFCIVDVCTPDGRMRRVAASHADPSAQPVLDELCARYPPGPDSPQPASRAVKTGCIDLLSEVDASELESRTLDAEHRALMRRLGVRSHIAVPLQLAQRTLGAISLGYVGKRRYRPEDVPLIEAVAARAAVAIENARLYRDAEAARAQAVAANRSKDEFLAMLGHELRNPLAPIVTALELTRAREGPSTERAVIERQVDHLRRLVDDLLDVSRITRGKVELDKRPTELLASVAEALELTRPLIEQREHTVRVDVAADLVVLADRVRLVQIVTNLVSNAARYTDPGGTIEISGARADDRGRAMVRLCVRDNGAGMAPDLLPHIFDMFVQGARSLDRAAGGLGLGLAIVKALVEQHGGAVRAHSPGVGKGSTLDVLIPESAEQPRAHARSSAPVVTAQIVRRRVLVVDDNVDAADMLVESLQLRGHTAVGAHDPHSALELVRTQPFDIGLIDVGLPDIDGYELGVRLRRISALQLVALTGYGQPGDRERSRAAGFAEHLVKPVDLDHLFETIERLAEPAPRA